MTEEQEALDLHTSAKRLKELAKKSYELQVLVAQNPSAPPELLSQMAQSFLSGEAPSLMQAILSNPNTPNEILLRCGWNNLEALLQNPIFPLLFLEDPSLPEKIPPKTMKQILASKDIPQMLLLESLKHKDIDVRYLAAAHPALPDEVLQTLANSSDLNILRGVAQNPKTPPGVLRQLFPLRDKWLEATLAENPNSPAELLVEIYSNTQDLLTRKNIAGNPNTPEAVLEDLVFGFEEDLAFGFEENVMKAAARNPKTPERALLRLAGHASSDVRRGVLENPGTTASIRSLYQRAGSSDLVGINQKTRALLPEELEQLSEGFAFARILAAHHPENSEENLYKLAASIEADVRREVAKNPKSTEKVLRRLLQDKDEEVRKLIGEHRNTTSKMLEALSGDPDLGVRGAVAANPNTPPETLRALFEKRSDPRGIIKKLVAKNPSIQIEWLAVVSQYRDPSLRQAAAQNPSLDEASLDRLSRDTDAAVRRFVAKHPKASAALLHSLAEDSDRKVAEAAKKRLGLVGGRQDA